MPLFLLGVLLGVLLHMGTVWVAAQLTRIDNIEAYLRFLQMMMQTQQPQVIEPSPHPSLVQPYFRPREGQLA